MAAVVKQKRVRKLVPKRVPKAVKVVMQRQQKAEPVKGVLLREKAAVAKLVLPVQPSHVKHVLPPVELVKAQVQKQPSARGPPL